MILHELTAGIEEHERVDEILISISPGRSTRQAPRMFVSMLKALEILVVDPKALPLIRIYSWWILLQNWSTLRFSDHRGLRQGHEQHLRRDSFAVQDDQR